MEFNDSKTTLIVTDGNETIKVDKKPYVHDCLDIYVGKYPQEYREAIKGIKTMTFYDGYAVADNCSLVFVYPTLKTMMERGDTFEFWEALDFYDDGLVTYYQIYYMDAIKDIYMPSEIKEFLVNVIDSKIENNALTKFTSKTFDMFCFDEINNALNRNFPIGTMVTTTFTFNGKKTYCTFKVKGTFEWNNNGFEVLGDGFDGVGHYFINNIFGGLSRNIESLRKATFDEIKEWQDKAKTIVCWTLSNVFTTIHIQSGHTLEDWKDYCNDTETEDDRLYDFSIEELMNGAVEPNKDIIYWLIGGRLYETFECVE